MHKSHSKAEVARRVTEVAVLLRVDGLLDRRPHELSGGQAQRVALGRAIVMEPEAFLLDEPLANLDAALRVEMRTEIKRIQKQLGTSTIFVTHDQEEALSLGDTIAVMKDGEVQQVGTPHEIYHRPANLFVGTFIGSPPLNCFVCTLHRNGDGPRLETAAFRLPISSNLASSLAQSSGHVTLGIRPEFVMAGPEQPDAFPAQVTLIEPLGSRTVVFLDIRGVEIRSLVQGEAEVRDGEVVHVRFQMDRAFFFDADGQRL
jgi:multiple sugar transport system ATP-binding protein